MQCLFKGAILLLKRALRLKIAPKLLSTDWGREQFLYTAAFVFFNLPFTNSSRHIDTIVLASLLYAISVSVGTDFYFKMRGRNYET
jgi:hypothetical protein